MSELVRYARDAATPARNAATPARNVRFAGIFLGLHFGFAGKSLTSVANFQTFNLHSKALGWNWRLDVCVC